MERRLGRGLGALLSESEPREKSTEVEIGSIRPNPFQPRRRFDPSALEELRDSIQAHGILQPIALRRRADGYELIAGERRWRAARLAGLTRIPAVVRDDVSDQQMLELALVENVQRQDLDPIERARAFTKLCKVLGLTQEQVADRVGLKRPTVTNLIRLLELPEPVQALVSDGHLSQGHARAILAVEGDLARTEVARQAIAGGWSVRATEQRAKSARPPARASTAGDVPSPSPAWITTLEDRLQTSLGTKVTIKNQREFQGQISLQYFNRADLERLIAILAPDQPLEALAADIVAEQG